MLRLSYGARYINPDWQTTMPMARQTNAPSVCPVCQGTASCLRPDLPGGARIFGDLSDPDSEVSAYVKKGAFQLNSKAVNIGPNVRYYASRKRDQHLIAVEAPTGGCLRHPPWRPESPFLGRPRIGGPVGRIGKTGAGGLDWGFWGALGVWGNLGRPGAPGNLGG